MTRSLQDRAREEWSLKQIVERMKVGDRGRRKDNVFFYLTEVDSNLGGVAIFSDTIGDRRHLRRYKVHAKADRFRAGTISFAI